MVGEAIRSLDLLRLDTTLEYSDMMLIQIKGRDIKYVMSPFFPSSSRDPLIARSISQTKCKSGGGESLDLHAILDVGRSSIE